VTAQNSSGMLDERLRAAIDIMQVALPDFIRKTKAKLENPG